MTFTVALPNTFDELATAQRKVDQFLATADVAAESAYIVRLCLEELVSNVIRHAFDVAAVHEITIRLDVTPQSIDLTVEDDGRPFDPSAGEGLPTPESLEAAPTGGMGLPLVRAMAGPIRYERIGDRNRSRVQIPL